MRCDLSILVSAISLFGAASAAPSPPIALPEPFVQDFTDLPFEIPPRPTRFLDDTLMNSTLERRNGKDVWDDGMPVAVASCDVARYVAHYTR